MTLVPWLVHMGGLERLGTLQTFLGGYAVFVLISFCRQKAYADLHYKF